VHGLLHGPVPAERLGYSPLGAGLRLVPAWVILTVIAPFSGVLIRRFGERVLVAGGLTAFAVGLAWVALIARTGQPYAELVVPLVRSPPPRGR
jgi:hypothetical protein